MGLVRRRPRCVAALLLASAVLPAVPAAGANAEKAPNPLWEPAAPSWDVRAVGASGRSVEIVYQEVGCGERGLHVSLREFAGEIAISVSSEVAVYTEGPEPPCLPPRLTPVTVPLAHSLAGRTIRGRSAEVVASPRRVFGTEVPADHRYPVPRLVGFAPVDARHALGLGYLRGTIARVLRRAGRPRVLAQSAAPGTSLTGGSIVRLVVSSPTAPSPRAA